MGSLYQDSNTSACPPCRAAGASPGPPASTQTWTPSASGLQDFQNSQQELQKSARLSFQAANMSWLIRLGLTPCTLPGISMRRVTESGSSLTTPSPAHSSTLQRQGFTSPSCTRSVLTLTQRERCEECDEVQLQINWGIVGGIFGEHFWTSAFFVANRKYTI